MKNLFTILILAALIVPSTVSAALINYGWTTNTANYNTYPYPQPLRQRVMVGTTTPYAQLTVSASSSPLSTVLFTVASSTGSRLFSVLGSGFVGAGTSTPWGLLSVNPNAMGAGPMFVVGSSTATQFIVAANGNIGIGTTTPYAKLSVVGETVGTNFTATSTTAKSTFPYASSTALTVSGTAYFPSTGGIWNSTGIGLGITPTVPFQVSVSNSGANLMTLRNTAADGFGGFDIKDNSDNLALQFGYGNSSAGFGLANTGYVGTRKAGESLIFISGGLNERVRITGTGLVGVATSSPWRQFSVAGTVAFNGLTSSATGNAVCITTSKDLTDSGGAACTPSSIKFKENVESLSPEKSIATLLKLRPVEFDYKDKQPHETNHSYGLIAEEVEAVDKNLVDYKNDGGIFGLHFEKITGLLVSSMQNVVARVSGLEKKVEEQDKRIAELERIIKEIK